MDLLEKEMIFRKLEEWWQKWLRLLG